ncbi:MAG: DNA repair protein RecO [Verrucomicrobiales bacterium]
MDHILTGVILRTRPLTESSLIVEVLSETEGRISLVAKGARRAKSPYAGKLDLFHEIFFNYVRSKRSDLHNFREIALGKTFEKFRNDLPMLYAASYAVSLVEKSTEPDTPIPEIYRHFRLFLEWLHYSGSSPRNIFAFELKLLSLLGFEPEIDSSFISPGSKKVADYLLRQKWEYTPNMELSKTQESELAAWIGREISRSFEHMPKGRNMALGIE